MLPTLYGIGANMGMGIFNNWLGKQTSDYDAYRNAQLNEEAAQMADARTRALYKDFYSPEAQMKQIKKAGLSPSVFYGGTPGQGGISGAMGGGGGGPQTTYAPISMIEGAQLAQVKAQTEAIKAQTKKTEEESQNIAQDTKLKEIQTEWQEMQKNEYSVEFKALTTYVIDEEGNKTSIYDYADNFTNYEKFSEWARKRDDIFSTEKGQKTLRSIWIARKHFNTQIAELSSQEVSAKFQENILKAMEDEDFIKLNAKAAVGYLKANIGTAELTERQKNAWLRLLDKFGDEGDWKQDLIIILGMIVNNAASNWKMPTIKQNHK